MKSLTSTLFLVAALASGACQSAKQAPAETASLPEIRYFMIADT